MTFGDCIHCLHPATHGAYCGPGRARAARLLTAMPALVEHLLSLPQLRAASGTEPSGTAATSPGLPFNEAAFVDANHIYATLNQLAADFAELLRRTSPAAARKAWRGAEGVVGLPHDITPDRAAFHVRILASWLTIHLDEILALNAPHALARLTSAVFAEDRDTRVAVTPDDDGPRRDLTAITHRWPLNPRATASKTTVCPDDGEKLLIRPPRHFGDDESIVCMACARIFTEDEHAAYGTRQHVARREALRVRQTAVHLAAKYASVPRADAWALRA